jgi:hypothetical protein
VPEECVLERVVCEGLEIEFRPDLGADLALDLRPAGAARPIEDENELGGVSSSRRRRTVFAREVPHDLFRGVSVLDLDEIRPCSRDGDFDVGERARRAERHLLMDAHVSRVRRGVKSERRSR